MVYGHDQAAVSLELMRNKYKRVEKYSTNLILDAVYLEPFYQ
jgi:hypothetical protein